MQTRALVVLFLMLGVTLGRSQGSRMEGSAADRNATGNSALSYRLEQPGDRASHSVLRKRWQVSGPIVDSFRGRRLRDVPRNLLRSLNPFAAAQPASEIGNVRGLTPRAWTSTVGWHPGASAFADPMTHESQMNLLSFSRPPRE